MIDESLRNYVLAVATRFVHDPDAAEDIAQLVLIKAVVALHHFRGESATRTWIFQITKRVALSEHRRAFRQRSLLARHRSEREQEAFEHRASEPSVVSWRVAAALRAGLMRLPQRQREIFSRWAMAEETTHELARVFAITPTSVRVTVSRARRTLRGVMREEHSRLVDELSA